MLTEVKTDGMRFRANGPAWRRKVKGEPATTKDGRPMWVARLTVLEDGRRWSEEIWVEVYGDEPVLAADDLVMPVRLIYSPWVNRKGELVRSYRADQILPAEPARKSA
ncbi:MAG: hypothetical protein ACLQDY_14280 [Streptosporangiaceae bacterium]